MSLVAPSEELTVGRQGHYAGGVSRLVAFAIDLVAIWGLFVLGVAAASFAIQLVTGRTPNITRYQIVTVVALFVWGFVYFAYQWALGGKTIGMAIFGLQVVAADGSPVGSKRAVVRTLVLPLSIIFAAVVFVWILVQRERRAWHDLIAKTAVVYAWDARAARLRWLSRQELSGPPGPVPPA